MRTCLTTLVETGQLDQPGLLIERFYPTGKNREEEQARFRHRVAGANASEAYRAAFDAWRTCLKESYFWTFEATLKTRLTVGLGVGNPGENGIALQRTYGVPVIPGSTIKGALRSCALELSGVHENVEPQWKRGEAPDNAQATLAVFGAADAMAAVTCFDAWWVPEGKPLCVETWTPHHQKYMTHHQKDMTQGAELPLESEDPTPLGLFAVPKGAKFRFAFQVPDPQTDWVETLVPVLTLALKRGLGAKHSQGYGRFEVPNLSVAISPDDGNTREADPTRDSTAPRTPANLSDGAHTLTGTLSIQGRVKKVRFDCGQERPVLEDPRLPDGARVGVRVQVTNGQIQREIRATNVKALR